MIVGAMALVARTILQNGSTGKERDKDLILDYFGARCLSSAQGQFTSPDPFLPMGLKPRAFHAWISNPQRWNRYAYALGNPLKFIDPMGLNACGINNDKNCKVEVEIRARHTDKNGAYDDQFKGVTNQGGQCGCDGEGEWRGRWNISGNNYLFRFQ